MRYSRVCYQIGESPEIGELLETNPLAAALFPLAIARADLFGILPRERRRFRSRVCPAANLDLEAVEQALADLERLDLIRSYQDDDGKPLLQITNYHRHQVVRWGHGVGSPDEQLPHWWSTPVELQEWLDSGKCRKPEAWRRRGFRVVDNTVNSSSTPVVLPENSNRAQHTDTDTRTSTSKDSAPPADAEAAHPTKLKKPRQESEDQIAIREAFEALTGEALPKLLPGYSAAEKLLTEYGLPMVREWTDFLRNQEPNVPEGANAWAHFKTVFRRGMNRDFEWRRKGSAGNGSERSASFMGWPSRFEVEAITGTFTDDELVAAASSPDYWYFPRHNINGTEQMRLEKARRDYERESASAQGK